ncbi:hypothetical protein LOTGIDRAFT_135266, partial [Lottia gigantea]
RSSTLLFKYNTDPLHCYLNIIQILYTVIQLKYRISTLLFKYNTDPLHCYLNIIQIIYTVI